MKARARSKILQEFTQIRKIIQTKRETKELLSCGIFHMMLFIQVLSDVILLKIIACVQLDLLIVEMLKIFYLN